MNDQLPCFRWDIEQVIDIFLVFLWVIAKLFSSSKSTDAYFVCLLSNYMKQGLYIEYSLMFWSHLQTFILLHLFFLHLALSLEVSQFLVFKAFSYLIVFVVKGIYFGFDLVYLRNVDKCFIDGKSNNSEALTLRFIYSDILKALFLPAITNFYFVYFDAGALNIKDSVLIRSYLSIIIIRIVFYLCIQFDLF